MAKERLEFKITHDKENKTVHLEKMTLEVAQAFVILFQAVAGIVDHTTKNKELTISVRKGSAMICVEGSQVATVEKKFRQVVESESTNSELVKQWREIQSLISKNGISYEANFYQNDAPVSILHLLKSPKKLRAKRKKRPPVVFNIEFLTGKLIAVGGKRPNIHVEIPGNLKPTIIDCNEIKANKAKAFLYKNIWFSAWSAKRGNDTDYELCDSYWEEQVSIFKDFSKFIEALKEADDEIESLKMVHYKCQDFLKENEFGIYRKFLRLFNTEHTDLNVLKTILIVSRPFNNHERLQGITSELNTLFEKKLAKT